MGRFFKTPIIGAFVSILVGGALLHHVSRGQLTYSPHEIASSPLLTLKKPMLDGLTLGMPRLYDHVAHIWVLQVFGDPELKYKNPLVLKQKVVGILNLTPKDEAIYLVPCFSFMFEFSRPLDCREILEMGLPVLRESWLIPTVLGYIESFRFKNHAKGREFFRMASNIAGAPPYLRTLADRDTPYSNDNNDEARRDSLINSMIGAGALAPYRQLMEHDLTSPPPLIEGTPSQPEPLGVSP